MFEAIQEQKAEREEALAMMQAHLPPRDQWPAVRVSYETDPLI